MPSSQLISVGNLHVANAIIGKANTVCLVGSDEEILTIFRSRSTRSRPIEQRTYDETCRITERLPHPPTRFSS